MAPAVTGEPLAAVILAGGRGSRLGGVEKGALRVGGERLVDVVAGAAREAGCDQVVIAGALTVTGATSVREDPPFGGPVAGLAAALAEVKAEWVMLLACDLPHARPLCRLLAGAMPHAADSDGLVASADGRAQWLAGVYRRTSLERALAGVDPAGASLRSVLGKLRLGQVEDAEGWSRDIDTPEDLEVARRRKGLDE